MLWKIYAFPLHAIALIMIAMTIVWAYVCPKLKKWRMVVFVALACAATLIILYTTLLSRTPGTYTAVLTPFAALAAARQQPELYREMLMNVFFPLGLTLSNALPRRWHRRRRIALTTLTGCILSAGIEYAQYRFSLGTAETDDVICNSLGALLGLLPILLTPQFSNHCSTRVK